MVDINLFEDDEEQLGKNEKTGEPSGKKEGGLSGDSLKEDDFSFDEDPVEASLDDPDDPLGEPGSRPKFEDENASRPKAVRGVGKSKKVSPLLIGVGVLAAAAIIFMQFVLPLLKPKTTPKVPSVTKNLPVKGDTTKIASRIGTIRTAAGSIGATLSQTSKYVEVTKSILENMGRDRQFVVLLLKGDQFFVEYSSPTRGTSESVGKKIQTLIGAADFTASREEQKKVGGGTMYFGVISGKLPAVQPPPSSSQKVTADQFIEQLKNQISKNGLSNTKIQKFSEYRRNSVLQTPVSLRAEGARNNVTAFLETLNSLQGNHELQTLIVVPQELTDLQANQLRMAAEFAVQ